MKFLVDAQLPPRLARALVAAGHDAVRTLDLPKGNRSSDRTVAEAAEPTTGFLSATANSAVVAWGGADRAYGARPTPVEAVRSGVVAQRRRRGPANRRL